MPLLAVAAFSVGVAGEDWPTYQHDQYRSGATPESLPLPLHESWRYASRHAPAPAWPEPGGFDFAHFKQELKPRVTYDRVFHVAVVGASLYFASSADDQVYALNAETGATRWSFFTGGPVRLAPSIWEGKVYVGSDDGCVYCLDAADGSLAWKYEAAPDSRWIPGNERLISVCPVRTGVLVADGVAYLGAGLFPLEGVYLCALDARSGAEVWKRQPDPEAFIGRFTSQRSSRRFALSPQGYLLASQERLYVPNGRTTPAVVDRGSGEILDVLECHRGEGGTYALLAEDMVIAGPGTQLRAFTNTSQDPVATFAGRCIIVKGTRAYLLSDTAVSALDRVQYDNVTRDRETLMQRKEELDTRLKDIRNRRADLSPPEQEQADREVSTIVTDLRTVKKEVAASEGREFVWTSPCVDGYAMILAGNTLFVGGNNVVSAFQASDGKPVWQGEVTGKAYGLAAANGRLFVSTDAGVIHCFGAHRGRNVRRTAEPAAPYPQDASGETIAAAAQRIVESTGISRGYCLDLGSGDGRLAYELARRTDLKVVCVDDDPGRVAAARAALDRAGIYGTRVTVQCRSLDRLPFTDYVANLVVSERVLVSSGILPPVEEVERVTRPCGGVAWIGGASTAIASARKASALLGARLNREALDRWTRSRPGWEVMDTQGAHVVLRRGPLQGGGTWSHQYADTGNSACSSDELVGGPMQLQWFGLPGPGPIVDRHHRANPPLAVNGRLFVPADNRIIAVDAYNGTLLWDVATPKARRLASPRDAGHMAASDERVYAAVDDACWVLDAATGRRVGTFPVLQCVPNTPHRWGYIATVDDLLLGSGQKPEANYTKIGTLGDYEIQWGDFKRLVTSDYLFCLDRRTGAPRWSYHHGVVVHPTIAVGDGRVYFVESRNPEALQDPLGRISLAVLLGQGARMAALDVRTGETVWETEPDLTLCQHILYLSYADNTLVVLGSGNRNDCAWYYLYAFDAATGALLWRAEHPNNKPGIGGDHGEQVHHPVIVGDTVVAEPVAYDLHTGARVDPTVEGNAGLAAGRADWALARREGCGTLSGSAHCLFYRDGFPCIHDLVPGGTRRKLNYVSRPGCWINMIAAGGVLLIPEASSGCSCPHPLQLSLAYIPQRHIAAPGP
jgi:outer membrane protein assembly factor BamB